MSAPKQEAISALEKIRRQRRGEAKATEQYEVRDENAEIFETVSEEKYSQLKQQRRADQWIEGDDGEDGYSDDGEEWWNSGSESEASPRAEARRKRRLQKSGASKNAPSKRTAADARAQGMRSLLQHFSSMAASDSAREADASRAAQTLGSSATAHLQKLQSLEAALNFDQEEEDDTFPEMQMKTASSRGHLNSPATSGTGYTAETARRCRGPLVSVGCTDTSGLNVFGFRRRADSAASVQKTLSSGQMCDLPSGTSAADTGCLYSAREETTQSPASDGPAGEDALKERREEEGEEAQSAESDEEDDSGSTAAGSVFFDGKQQTGDFSSSRSASRLKKSLGEFGSDWILSDESADKTEARAVSSQSSSKETDSTLPVCADGSLPFYLVDVWSDANSGSVFLFGKVWAGATASSAPPASSPPPQSCCVVVSEMERPLFFFLRSQVQLDPSPEELAVFEAEAQAGGPSVDSALQNFAVSRMRERQETAKAFVVAEARRLKEKYQWRRMRVKAVSRNYAFDAPGMPRKNDLQFVKVLVPASAAPLAAEDLSGETYSHVFGVEAPLCETLLIKRGIKGPCWLKVEGFSLPSSPSEKLSWCRHEVRVSNHKQIRPWNAKIKNSSNSEGSGVAQDPTCFSEMTVLAERDGPVPPSPPLNILSLVLKPLLCRGSPDDGGIAVASLFVMQHCNVDNPLQRPALTREGSFCGVRRLRPGRGLSGKSPSLAGPASLGGTPCPFAISGGLPAKFKEQASANGVEVFDTEAQLLLALLTRIHSFDPDVLLAHDCFGASLQLLGSRLATLNLPLWHRVSRLKRAKAVRAPLAGNPFSTKGTRGLGPLKAGRLLTVGRLVCDTYLQAKEILGHRTNYELRSLLRELLPTQQALPGKKRQSAASRSTSYEDRLREELTRLIPFPTDDLQSLFHSARPDGLLAASGLARREAFFALVLALRINCLSISKELACVSGAPWMLSLQNKRAERNAFLLMHVFHGEKFVYPDPPSSANSAGLNRRRQQGSHFEEEDALMGEEERDREGDEDGRTGFAAKSRGRAKAAYTGGLVLEPRVGLYDSFVLLLDFNSLYPSIIQEFNVCFSTVRRPQLGTVGEDEVFDDKEEALAPDASEAVLGIDSSPGILPRILRSLVERRRHVKSLMAKEKDDVRRQQLQALQLAVKLTANSIYGCLGFSGSRFCSKMLAAFITRKGREMLTQAKEKAERDLGLCVIYGDTDSIMVDTGMRDDGSGRAFAEAEQVGMRLKREINRKYRCLEIDLEAIFARLLLLKKKKYACSIVKDFAKREFIIQLKGLDFVRRDWALMTKQAGHQLLNIIFSSPSSPSSSGDSSTAKSDDVDVKGLNRNGDNNTSTTNNKNDSTNGGDDDAVDSVVARLHERLRAMKEAVLGGRLPLDLFVITKSLTKPPEAYAQGAAPQPHVSVALRLLRSGRGIRAGTEIPYVICSEESVAEAEKKRRASEAGCIGSGNEKPKDANSKTSSSSASHRSPAERAFHPLEVTALGLKPDLHYYLSQQLFPPIERLCAFVQGTNPARLAECLGLDPRKVARPTNVAGIAEEDSDAEAEVQSGEDRILALVKKDEEAFKGLAIPVHAPCGACGKWTPATEAFKVRYILAIQIDTSRDTLECTDCHEPLSPSALRSLLLLFLSHLRATFHSHRPKCSECQFVFDFLPASPLSQGPPLRCPRCETGRLLDAFPARELYRHLQHLQFRISLASASAASGGSFPILREAVFTRISLDGCHAAVYRGGAFGKGGQQSALASNASALTSFSAFGSRQTLQVSRQPMRKVLELKWPRVCACLRYLKSLKEGAVGSLGLEQERLDLASAVNDMMRKSAYNVLR